MINILAWIVLGFLAGGIAKMIMPGKDPGGCFITIILGIIGAVVGGFVGRLILGIDIATTESVVNWNNFGISVLGALIVLAIYRMMKKR